MTQTRPLPRDDSSPESPERRRRGAAKDTCAKKNLGITMGPGSCPDVRSPGPGHASYPPAARPVSQQTGRMSLPPPVPLPSIASEARPTTAEDAALHSFPSPLLPAAQVSACTPVPRRFSPLPRAVEFGTAHRAGDLLSRCKPPKDGGNPLSPFLLPEPRVVIVEVAAMVHT